MDRGVYGRYRTDLPLLRPADMDQPLRLGLAAGISVCSALLLMLFRMSKNLLLCGVQRDLIGPLPFNCRCLSRLLQVGAGFCGRLYAAWLFLKGRLSQH